MIRMVSRTNVTDAAYYYNLGIAESKLGHKTSALANLQKAADLYQEQKDESSYQKTLDMIRIVYRKLR
jgi:tetratricopeptide (TPR) repeat protein